MHDLETRLGSAVPARPRRLPSDRGWRGGHRATASCCQAVDRFQTELASRHQQLSGPLADRHARQHHHPSRSCRSPRRSSASIGRDNAVELTLQVLTPAISSAACSTGHLQIAIMPRHQKIAGLRYERLFREVNYFYCGRRHPMFHARRAQARHRGDRRRWADRPRLSFEVRPASSSVPVPTRPPSSPWKPRRR